MSDDSGAERADEPTPNDALPDEVTADAKPASLYTVEYTKSAAKELDKIKPPNSGRIAEAVEELAHNPRSMKVEKLEGGDDLYKRRIGSFRVKFRIDDVNRVVTIVEVGDRKEVYRKTR